MLAPGGRLVAITSRNCIPNSTDWHRAFGDISPQIAFTAAIDGHAYARRGTSFDTRLTVLDNTTKTPASFDPSLCVADAGALLDTIAKHLPPRDTLQTTDQCPQTDLFNATTKAISKPRAAVNKTVSTPTPSAPTKITTAALEYTIPAPSDRTTSLRPTDDAGPYQVWESNTVHIPNAQPHPTPLVQSAAMAAVPHPTPSYQPILPTNLATDALLSDAQLESVILAGQAFSHRLNTEYEIASDWETTRNTTSETNPPISDDTADGTVTYSDPVQFRRGWMLGDGTGCGKGRQVSAIIFDNWQRGIRRTLWLSQSDKLLDDARRDWSAIGGDPAQVFPITKFKQGVAISPSDGILFATYSTLRSPSRQGKQSRLEQIIAWLAGSLDEDQRHAFNGVIVFDEAHAMANAASAKTSRGQSKPSQQGRAGLRLQNALPDARIMYVSATGATTLPGLAYATRLGLWGSDKTPFQTRNEFLTAMESGGVAAMEVVARDLKALGLYQARALSYTGVEVEILEHPITAEQHRVYDSYANAFKIIHANLKQALENTGITEDSKTLNKNAKAAAMSAFEGSKQRFFGHLITSMKCPTLLKTIAADLDAGHAPVVQLVSTGEALLERRISEIPPSEWKDLTIDLTPREYILEYLAHSFPTHLYETFTDDDGNEASRPVFDDDNNPVQCQQAIADRDALIQRLSALPPLQSALDQIIHHFGHDTVAEITGRTRRVLRITDDAGQRFAIHTRPPSSNLTEAAEFINGGKNILVFSLAGGIGRSYHADLHFNNTARRIHYLLEPGWRADQAIQGLGRTHRTHQASAPLFRPVTSNIKGERRFIATIAKRLDSLGAITRGQRNSQTAMGANNATLFRAADNFESIYAKAALRQFYLALYLGRIDNWSISDFETATGLKLTYETELKEDLPPMHTFLNRLLALPIDEQNSLFSELEDRIEANINQAVEAGTYELGVETVIADSLTITSREPAFTHEGTDLTTDIVEILRRNRITPLTADQATTYYTEDKAANHYAELMTNSRSNHATLVVSAPYITQDDGTVQQRVRLLRPTSSITVPLDSLEASHWSPADEPTWRRLWDDEIKTLPTHHESRFWLVTGLLLPIWDRLPPQSMRVRRLITDAGDHLLGRLLYADEITALRDALGLETAPDLTPDELHAAILSNGSTITLHNGWRLTRRLTRRLIMGLHRVELEGPIDTHLPRLTRIGCVTELINWTNRLFVPAPHVLAQIINAWPIKTANQTTS